MPDFGLVVAQWNRLRVRHPTLEPALVVDMIRATIAAVSGDLDLRKAEIQAEIDSLSSAIAMARNEIVDLGVDEIMAYQIPAASSELNAIVAHTASATDTILDSCEMVDGVAERLDSDEGRQLQNATTRIYEACSFQDITGQRIVKVMAALKAIDAGLTSIGVGLAGVAPRPAVLDSDGHLTSGPQLPGWQPTRMKSTDCWRASISTRHRLSTYFCTPKRKIVVLAETCPGLSSVVGKAG